MTQFIYKSQNGAPISFGPFDPTVGQHVNKAHRERTFRHAYRLDGSLAGTEERDSLLLETDGPAYGLMEGKRRRAQAARLDAGGSGFWYTVRSFGVMLADWVIIFVGSALAYSVAHDVTGSGLLGLGAVLGFLVYCAWLRTNA
jgi:hypothetical protein